MLLFFGYFLILKSTTQQSLVTFVVPHLLLQHLSPLWGCCLSQSYSLIGGFFGCLPCRLFLGCLQHFACSSPLLFRVFSCNLWLLLCLCCFAALLVSLFVCNLGCRMLRLFGCRMDSGCCQSFQPLKTSEAASAFCWMVLDGLVCCLCG